MVDIIFSISIQPLHAKFLLCHDGIIRGVIDLLAVDRIFIGMVLLSLFIRNLSHFSVDSFGTVPD